MKKLFITLSAVIMALSLNATDLWTGSKHVSWTDGGIDLNANDLQDVQPGNMIKVHYTSASTNLEFKVMKTGAFYNMPGSRIGEWIEGDGAFEQFLTATAVEAIKEYGLQIIGGDFICTKVELLDGKAGNLKDGFYFWTGYRWIENDKTYEYYYRA